MISFETFSLAEGVPLYRQIELFVKRGVIAGSIQNGDELPSRRVLSALLGVNPNTVQKAYRALEEQGLIASHTGAKSLVVVTSAAKDSIRSELLAEEIVAITQKLKQMGVSHEEALALLTTYWELP